MRRWRRRRRRGWRAPGATAAAGSSASSRCGGSSRGGSSSGSSGSGSSGSFRLLGRPPEALPWTLRFLGGICGKETIDALRSGYAGTEVPAACPSAHASKSWTFSGGGVHAGRAGGGEQSSRVVCATDGACGRHHCHACRHLTLASESSLREHVHRTTLTNPREMASHQWTTRREWQTSSVSNSAGRIMRSGPAPCRFRLFFSSRCVRVSVRCQSTSATARRTFSLASFHCT